MAYRPKGDERTWGKFVNENYCAGSQPVCGCAVGGEAGECRHKQFILERHAMDMT